MNDILETADVNLNKYSTELLIHMRNNLSTLACIHDGKYRDLAQLIIKELKRRGGSKEIML